MAESKEAAAGSSRKVKKEEKKYDMKEVMKKEEPKPKPFDFPYHIPVRRSSATTIERFSASLQRYGKPRANSNRSGHRSLPPWLMGAPGDGGGQARCPGGVPAGGKQKVCGRLAVHGKVLSLVGSARSCYAGGREIRYLKEKQSDEFADMMFLAGWFLLQFMVSMFPDDPDAPPEADLLMSRAEVHTRINDIARDLLLLENQVPWLVLEAHMASAFIIGNEDNIISDNPRTDLMQPAPPHLLGPFYRRQVGAARTRSLRVPRLSSLSSTAVELAEMGVKLTASKTSKFGDMSMSKRSPGLSLSGELTLPPLVLNHLTACWLINMAAYEACLGATQADNFAVSSYVCVLSLLMNRKEDTQELRAKGIINSAFCDKSTLGFFKGLAPHLHVGHRYYQVFQQLQEYKQERWVWITLHRFLYKNIKTILALFSVAGVLAGLFKTILSLRSPR